MDACELGLSCFFRRTARYNIMSDAWALFGSDDDDDDDTAGATGGAAKKRHRADEVAAAGVRFGAPRGGLKTATTASEHAYFAASRQLWTASSSAVGPPTLAGFLHALTADASRRVDGIAIRLRKFKPEGPSAADALTASQAAAEAIMSEAGY